jgi:hypothetical protein
MDHLTALPLTVLLHLIEHFRLSPHELSRLAQLSQYYRATLRPAPGTERLWRVVLTPVAHQTLFQRQDPRPPLFVVDRFDAFLRARVLREHITINLEMGITPTDLAYVCGLISRNTRFTSVHISNCIGDNDAKSFNMLVDAILPALMALARARGVYIRHVPIADVSPFARLIAGTRLYYIRLSNCGIRDVAPIAQALAGNQIADIIMLQDNDIEDADPLFRALAGCRVHGLALDRNKIRSIAPFQWGGELRDLGLAGNLLESADAIADAVLQQGGGSYTLALEHNNIAAAGRMPATLAQVGYVRMNLSYNRLRPLDKAQLRESARVVHGDHPNDVRL